MLDGKLTCERVARALLDVGAYEGLLDLDLLLRQLEDAVFIDPVADLAERVRNVARRRCSARARRVGLLRETGTRGQQQQSCHRCEQRFSELGALHPLRDTRCPGCSFITPTVASGGTQP